MKQTVTYIIRHRDMPIYITNKPTDNNSDISYSTNRNRAREFNGTGRSEYQYGLSQSNQENSDRNY